MKWFEIHPEKTGLRIWFYLLLTLSVALDLGHPGYRFLTSSGVEERTGCELDSFSEPSIAAAILKQEVERLFSVYARQRDHELVAAFTDRSAQGNSQPCAEETPRDERGCETAAARRAEGRTATIQSLEHLHAEVEELKCVLEVRLLTIHYETGSWPKFLDEYLKFVRESPESRFVVDWATCALVHAQECGRNREVVEAMEHAAQVHSESKTACRVRKFLERHCAEDPHNEKVANP